VPTSITFREKHRGDKPSQAQQPIRTDSVTRKTADGERANSPAFCGCDASRRSAAWKMPTQIRLLAATQLYPRLIRHRYRSCATRLESQFNPQLAPGQISTGCR
jgi:hypothetical protein